MPIELSKNYLRFNDLQTKNVTIIVRIPGVDLLSNRPIYTYLRYGEPGEFYGGTDRPVYGGLVVQGGVRDIISLDKSSLTISQRLEPEQGKGSISTMSVAFIDKDQYMTQVISPGVIIPEILGQLVEVFIGYQEISWPEDYLLIFRGRISELNSNCGLITLSLSDPNLQRRQQVFYTATTQLANDINLVDSTIQVLDNTEFYSHVLGPTGVYDVPIPWNPDGTYNPIAPKTTGVRTFLKIDDEYIEYGPLGYSNFASAQIEDVVYTSITSGQSPYAITYTDGAIAGSEIVTLLGAEFNVQIQSGVSTADQVIHAVNTSPVSDTIITASLAVGSMGSSPQSVPLDGVSFFISFTGCLRAARGTVAANHTVTTEVSNSIEFSDHAIDMALKLMLGGYAGPWISSVPIYSILRTFDFILGDQAGAIIFPEFVDPVQTYGVVPGDFITISGSGIFGNNQTGTIIRFADLNGTPNRIMYTTMTLTAEYPTTGTIAIRTQYDTYPTACSTLLTSQDVDVQSHIDLKNTYLSDQTNSYRFFITAPENLKNFVEKELYLPIAAYSLTKRGSLSIGYTKPPIADQTLNFLDKDSILNPEAIRVTRSATNARKFYNEIDWSWDVSDDGRTFQSLINYLDADSLSQIGVLSQLPITSRGARTDLGTNSNFQKRSSFLLSRYKRGALIVDVKSNWKLGCQIEAGDVVALRDDGFLQISNFQTGERNLGTQLFEVVNRDLDIKSSICTLQLISGLGTDVTDRYAVFSPSSFIVSGDNSSLIIEDSFGALYPGDEMRKWRDFQGDPIVIHDELYTYYEQTTITGFDPGNNYRMFISGLATLPGSFAGLVIDIPNYPTTPSKTNMSIYKSIFAFRSAQVSVTSGASKTQFAVGSGDIDKFFIGAVVIVANESYSLLSIEAKVTNIVGLNISVDKNLGFIPDNTCFVFGIGFADQSGFYRYI